MTINTARFVGLFLRLFLLSLGSFLQAQRPVWVQYDTNNGLPGNEVYDMLEAQDGHLWFATNQGICRFNGYEFIRAVDTSAMEGSATFNPEEDAEGGIWFNYLNHSVHRVVNDTVRAWKYNSVIDQYRGKFSLIEQMIVADDGTVWLALKYLGLLAVWPDGAHKLFTEYGEDSFLFHAVDGRVICTSISQTSQSNTLGNVPKFRRVALLEEEEIVKVEGVFLKATDPSILGGGTRLRNGDFLVFDAGAFCLLRDKQPLRQAEMLLRARKIYEWEDGSLFVASHFGENPGLFRAATLDQLAQGRYVNYLPGHFVTAFHGDREGGWWAATHDRGVFYCKNPGIEVWDASSGLPSDDVICLTDDGKQTIYLGLRPVAVCAVDQKTGKTQMLPRPPTNFREISVLHWDALRDRLWCGNPLFFFRQGQWESLYDAAFYPMLAKRIIPDPTGDRLWVSSSFGFYRIENESQLVEHLGSEAPISSRTYCVAPEKNGNLWVSTIEGLRLWEEGHYTLPPFEHPALKYEVSDVKFFPAGGMAISFRGGGLLLIDREGRLAHLTERNGLTGNFISSLFVSASGALLACANSGLNLLRQEPGGNWHISVLTIKQGLPSNRINDVRMLDDVIWLATDKGLVRVREVPQPAPMHQPVLEKLLVNNQQEVLGKKMNFSHRQNDLTIQFYALSYRAEGKIFYRYRLLGADTAYAYSPVRVVNFANLSPGEYTFEVQAQNEGGAWSLPAQWSFCIRPAWWQTGWFWGGVFTLFLGTGGWWYRRQLQQARLEAGVQSRMRELEAAALRAQINPHFIFNCLTSIQAFVEENETAEATSYLARFARLIRQALHGSVDGVHTLADEVDMLDNYLALEQLRFGDKFSYFIHLAPELDPEEVFIPALLVQPFVENAILHGIKDKAGDGRIEVVFSRNEEALQVVISDNGPGFSMKKPKSNLGYRPVGTLLTQQRLEILSGKVSIKAFQAENLVDAEGITIGARVALRIPMD